MESALLIAVRDRLRSEVPFDTFECACQLNEIAPGIASQKYCIVMPAGYVAGPRQNTSGTVRDRVFSVRVTLVMRCTNIARDRLTDAVFLANLVGMEAILEKIDTAIDWKNEVSALANTAMSKTAGASGSFIEPLRFTTIDAEPRIVSGSLFKASPNEQFAAIARSIIYSGARTIRNA